MLKLPGCHPWRGGVSVWVGSYKGLEERSGILEMPVRGWERRVHDWVYGFFACLLEGLGVAPPQQGVGPVAHSTGDLPC